MMKQISILIILISFLLPFFAHAETIDQFISKEQNKPGKLWSNGMWVSIPVYDPKNIDSMLRELYKKISYKEGKPKKWVIVESKIADFGYGKFLIVRVKTFGKEHIHFFSTTRSKDNKEFLAR